MALDIDPQELAAGLQLHSFGEYQTARVFLADATDNGAGFAVELGQAAVFESILTQTREDLTQAFGDSEHSACTSSCPDCLRSWDNQKLHGALDWRLALDMLDLAAGRNLSLTRWFGNTKAFVDGLNKVANGELEIDLMGELLAPVVRFSKTNSVVIVGHPLWWRDSANEAPEMMVLKTAVSARWPGAKISQSDFFEMDRRPLKVLQTAMM